MSVALAFTKGKAILPNVRLSRLLVRLSPATMRDFESLDITLLIRRKPLASGCSKTMISPGLISSSDIHVFARAISPGNRVGAIELEGM